MGLSEVNSVGKGLKKYRLQEILHEIEDTTLEPGEEVVINPADYEKYVNRIAIRFFRKLPPNSRWDLEEFKSEAWLALVDCAKNYYRTEYNDSLKAFAYSYIVKRLSEFMATNMYSLKARYYNVKKSEKNFEKINKIERTLWTESQCGSNKATGGEINPLLQAPSGIVSMVDEVGKKEEQDIIKQIVNVDLPKRERRAIVRRFRDGETYREIGKRLKVSPETARKLVMRGIKIIKEKAKDAGINSSQEL